MDRYPEECTEMKRCRLQGETPIRYSKPNPHVRTAIETILTPYQLSGFATVSDFIYIDRLSGLGGPFMNVTHVGLNLSVLEYTVLFNVPLLSTRTGTTYRLEKLIGLPNLVQLDLKFRDPRWLAYKNLWTQYSPPGPVWSSLREPIWRSEPVWLCYDTVVRMILTYALPTVRKVRKVCIEGYVRRRTRDTFYDALEELRADPEKQIPSKASRKYIKRRRFE